MSKRFSSEQLNALTTPERRAALERTLAARLEGIVILEDIYDPHNAQAVFRSCDAYGIQRVCLVFDKQEPFNPRAIGKLTSASANKWLTFQTFADIASCYRELRKEGYIIFATALTNKAVSIFEADLSPPRAALAFGNEHAGLSHRAVEEADKVVMIPMRGMVQSLNLSVTTATFLFEMTRQRITKGLEAYQLASEKQQELLERFILQGTPLYDPEYDEDAS